MRVTDTVPCLCQRWEPSMRFICGICHGKGTMERAHRMVFLAENDYRHKERLARHDALAVRTR